MAFKKRVNTVTIKDLLGNEGEIPTGKTSDDVLFSVEHEQTLIFKFDEETVEIPFHVLDSVVVTTAVEDATRNDPFCVKGCSSMADPTIIGDMSELTETAGEEFDPLEGITAKDDNGQEVEVTVDVVEGE